ncbi:hypothetical protein [Cellulomonas cellasea]|uniref:DUF3153 domain-containing protein n=1 Tax=Cellulomonas cellasea TaxID=43670 RepID=A0A7W4UK44_9CELL|nr:hypothetical protein [Cellulomonas cellasea]MBB2925205.1 hypothetical protein [Cellulomonas cellasea]
MSKQQAVQKVRVGLVTAALMLLVGCSAGPYEDSFPDEPRPGELSEYQDACEDAASTATRQAQTVWPRALTARVDDAIDYHLTIDARDTPLPPETYVTDGVPGVMGDVRVSCRLYARLTGGDTYADVVPGSTGVDGWIERTVNGAGIYQWSWSVTFRRPGPHHLNAEVKPVVLDVGGSTSRVLELPTSVTVEGSWIQRSAWWIERQTGAAKIIGGAIIALLTWISLAWAKSASFMAGRKKPAGADAET